MGRALYQHISRHPSPRSPAHPLASPCSPKHFLATPKSPSYLSPRSPRYLSPLSPRHPNYVSPPPLSPKHPNYLSPPPEPQVFVDAKNKDLPFDGGCKMPSQFTFEPCLGLKEQGELLMNFLTGVPGSPMENLIPKMHHLDSSNVVVIDEHKARSLHGTQRVKNFLDINRRRFEKKPPPPFHPILKDMAVDTLDLDELTGDHDREDAGTDYDEREEAQRKLLMEMEENDGKKTITLEDYLEMVKKSTGRIGLQAQLLHELSLGEDADMGVPDSELPALLPLEKMGTEFKPGESQLSKDRETKAIPIYRGAMRATSLVIKRLRRMAGLMHTEQQNVDLKDVYDWLQHLGYLATSSGKVGSSTLCSSSAGHSVTGEKIDWRLPSSPAQALQMAQADLRDRLAYLYEEQNQIKNSKEQLEAAKRLVGKRISKREEVGYEELGGRIVQNLDDVKSLETKFKTLSEKDKVDEELGERKSGKKERKQDKKAGARGKGSPSSGDEGTGKSSNITKKEKGSFDEKESKDSTGVSDGDQSENEGLKRKRSMIEKGRSDGTAGRKASIQETGNAEGISSGRKLDESAKRFGRNIKREGARERASIKTQEQDSGFSGIGGMRREGGSGSIRDDKGNISESGRGFGAMDVDKLRVQSQHVATSDKATQTDNSELLLLMESMIDAMNQEDPEGRESPATKLKRLLKENKRMQVQLRFWRSRNWLESTVGARLSRSRSQSASSRTRFPLPPSTRMDSSSEDDFSMYFNPIRPPSILSQGAPSVGSSASEDYSYAQATGRPRNPSIIFGQEGTNRSMPSGGQAGRKFNKALQQNLPSIPAASSPNRSNTDILLETLQEMQPHRLEASNAMLSRSRNPEGIQTSSPSEPMNSKLNLKSPSQRFQPRSSNGGNTHPVPPILLEPLNGAVLTNKQKGMITQSPPQLSQSLSARLPSNQLQPIPAEVLNAALKSKAPSQVSRQLAPRTIPSLNFGSAERFPPGKSISATSRTAKMSKSLHPLLSEPSTSRVDMELSPVDDALLSSSLPITQPIEHEAQAIASPRNARNVSRNLSPRSPRPLVNLQQIQDGQASSGSPPRSPRRVASPMRRSHPPANSKGPLNTEFGLMIVGRSSTTQ